MIGKKDVGQNLHVQHAAAIVHYVQGNIGHQKTEKKMLKLRDQARKDPV